MKKNILSLAILISLNCFSQKAGIVFSNMDLSVNPRNDFYSYCNGTWQKNFVLPESDARYGSFNEIHNNNDYQINDDEDKIQFDPDLENKAKYVTAREFC